MGNIDEYNTFKDLGKYYPSPVGYKKIRVNLVYDVKHDRCHKARLLAEGHLTEIQAEIFYSVVVSLYGIQLLIFISDINKMETWYTYIWNTYLEAKTLKKVYIISGT